MTAQWRTVAIHGQPAPGDAVRLHSGTVHIRRPTENDYPPSARWMPRAEFQALLPDVDDIAPPPLPKPWQPMSDLIDDHEGRVWFACVGQNSKSPTFVEPGSHTRRADDETMGRIAWAPFIEGYPAPEHPHATSAPPDATPGRVDVRVGDIWRYLGSDWRITSAPSPGGVVVAVSVDGGLYSGAQFFAVPLVKNGTLIDRGDDQPQSEDATPGGTITDPTSAVCAPVSAKYDSGMMPRAQPPEVTVGSMWRYRNADCKVVNVHGNFAHLRSGLARMSVALDELRVNGEYIDDGGPGDTGPDAPESQPVIEDDIDGWGGSDPAPEPPGFNCGDRVIITREAEGDDRVWTVMDFTIDGDVVVTSDDNDVRTVSPYWLQPAPEPAVQEEPKRGEAWELDGVVHLITDDVHENPGTGRKYVRAVTEHEEAGYGVSVRSLVKDGRRLT